MTSSDVDIREGKRAGALSQAIVFGLVGGFFLGVAGGVEGVAAFYAFRAIHLSLFPHHGAFVMTAVSSQLPLVLTTAGALGGAIGLACFAGGRRAQEDAKAALSALVQNALIGSGLGVFFGGISALALGRALSQDPITLFVTFFGGVFFGFLMGLIASLLLSLKARPSTA